MTSIEQIDEESERSDHPDFRPGDTVRVNFGLWISIY